MEQKKRAIIVDSTANIGEELFNHPQVYQANLTTQFGEDDTYQDTWHADKIKEFYDKMRDSKELPTSSQPSPMAYIELFDKMLEHHVEEVFVLTISDKISGTFKTAQSIAKEYEDKLTIHVIDSQTSSYGLKNMVIHLLKWMGQNKATDDILSDMDELIKRTIVFAAVPDLTNLKKGGRISHIKGMIAGVLKLKPILKVHEGYIQPVENVRGFKRTLTNLDQHLIDYVKEMGEDSDYKIAVVHSNDSVNASKKAEDIKTALKLTDDRVVVDDLTIVIATQVGEGVVAYIYLPQLP